MIYKKIPRLLPALLITFLFLAVFRLNSYSQNTSLIVKHQFINAQKQSLKDTIRSRTNIDYPFIIGYNYVPLTNTSNHPYFKENKWFDGSLVYKDFVYPVKRIKYDTEIDKLIYLLYDKDNTMNSIALDENFILEFSISNSTFRYFNDLKNEGGTKLKAGYYEVVYDGKLKFLVRNEKLKSLNDYRISTDMYLLKNGAVISVRNMGKLISQIKDKESTIKKFVSDNSLILNETDYSSASKILKFYESL